MTTQETKKCWWHIGGDNIQADYGYGTADEAGRYCKYLNRGREVNMRYATGMTEEEAAEVGNGHLEDWGMCLADELQALKDDGRL